MMSDVSSRVLYEDNHIIIINKLPGEIVQADRSGDVTLMDDVKDYLKVKYGKPGNVFLGLPHRLDRPTSFCQLPPFAWSARFVQCPASL